jgi:hypothetical protein
LEKAMQRKALLSIIAVGALVVGQSALSTSAEAQGRGWARHSGTHVGYRGPGPRFGAYAGPRYRWNGYRNYGWRSSAWVPAAVAGATIGLIGAAAAAPYYYDDYAYYPNYAYYDDYPEYQVGYTYWDAEPTYPAYDYAYSYPGYAYAPARRVVYRTGAPYRTHYRSGYAYRPRASAVR